MIFKLYHLVMVGGALFILGIFVGIFIAHDTVKFYQELLEDEKRKHHVPKKTDFRAN